MNIYLNFADIKNTYNNTIDLRDNIRYLYPKKNTVMNGEFTKLLLSKNMVTMNGLYLYLPISVEKKRTANNEVFIRYITNTTSNMSVVRDLKLLEKALLSHYQEYNKRYKQIEYILDRQLSTNQIRVYHDNNSNSNNNKLMNNNNYVIKISGVWETDSKIGMTYKIMELY
jgi:hypothetical protein